MPLRELPSSCGYISSCHHRVAHFLDGNRFLDLSGGYLGARGSIDKGLDFIHVFVLIPNQQFGHGLFVWIKGDPSSHQKGMTIFPY